MMCIARSEQREVEDRFKYFVEVKPAASVDSATEDGVIDTSSSHQHRNSKPLVPASLCRLGAARCVYDRTPEHCEIALGDDVLIHHPMS